MNFSYNFNQAHNDRLEEAGVVRYNQHPQEGIVIEPKNKRQTTARRIKQVITTATQIILK